MVTLEERVAQLEADLPTRRGYVKHLEALQEGQRLTNQRLTNIEGDVAGLKGDVAELKGDVAELKGDVAELKVDVSSIQGDLKLIVEHFKIAQ